MSHTSVPKRRYHVLIVDDEPLNAQMLAHILRDTYQITIANSGSEALRVAHGPDKPDLVLLDVIMPDIDGYEVCRRLKDNDATKDIMVIFVTAMSDIAAEEVGLNLGALDYITKPLHPPIIRARVRNHMNVKVKTDMLEALSYIDGLTHVPNRRRFDELLQQEWRRGTRSGLPLSLIMIDFDHFKALNDHYGHGRGDVCLQRGAAALSEALKRPGDILARYGGEEFVSLLPETDAVGALAMAEAMHQAVDELRLEHAYSPIAGHVTISLGVASGVPSGCWLPEDLLESADQALNEAKRAGRNRVIVAPPLSIA